MSTQICAQALSLDSSGVTGGYYWPGMPSGRGYGATLHYVDGKQSNWWPMKTRTLAFAALVAASAFATDTAALVLSINPHAQVASVGDLVEVAVRYDDEGSLTLGGAFSIEFDDASLEPVAYAYSLIGDPRFQNTPRKYAGRLNDFTVASFSGIQSGDLVTVTFRVLRDGQHTVTILPSSLGSLWPSALDFGTFFTPDHFAGVIATDASPIPVISVPQEVVGERIFPGGMTRIGVGVYNAGNAALQVQSAGLTSNPGAAFTIIDDSCSAKPLAPGNQCDIGVAYAAAGLPFGGSQTARMQIDSNDSFRPRALVALRGVVASPKVSISSHEFYAANIGAPYRVYRATLFNEGEWPAAIDSVETGVNIPADWFQLVGNECTGRSLGIGERCTIELAVRANEAGRGFTFLNVRHDNGSFRPSFTLWGYTPTPLFQVVTDGPLVFDMPAGATTTRRVTVTNKGPGDLTLGGREVNSNAQFLITDDTCSDRSIGPGQSCSVALRISLPAVGTQTHFVLFETNSLLVSRFLNSYFQVTAR